MVSVPASVTLKASIPEREIISRYLYALAAYLHASLGNLEEARWYPDSPFGETPDVMSKFSVGRHAASR